MPDGKPAGQMDKIMVLSIWTNHFKQTKQALQNKDPIIAAGMGKPTFPIHLNAVMNAMAYWEEMLKLSIEANQKLCGTTLDPKLIDELVKARAAIDYGHPQGDIESREKMACALAKWYENKVTIGAEDVMFTVGGAAALHLIFKVINKRVPHGLIVTPFPRYTLYAGTNPKNNLFPIDLMKEKGYRLTAEILEKGLKAAQQTAKKQGTKLSAFLLCDPNSPLGQVLGESELIKIAAVLRKYPDMKIILDEAYAEMQLDGNKRISLLQVAPDLKDRIILMRSATKGLSDAGERMAVTVAFDTEIMGELLQESVNIYGHPPRSLQSAYAGTMEKIVKNTSEIKNSALFYKMQVDFVYKSLKEIGASLPDPTYKVEGGFYVLADLSDLRGMALSNGTETALNKTGDIANDEDICYDLLFRDGVSIAPLSYFGISPKLGYLRITCSGGFEELKILIDRIATRLVEAREIQQKELRHK